eukprot:c48274_g1_i1 orf=1-159(-)
MDSYFYFSSYVCVKNMLVYLLVSTFIWLSSKEKTICPYSQKLQEFFLYCSCNS